MWWQTLGFWLLVAGFFGVIVYLVFVEEKNYFEVHLDDDSAEKDEEIERLQRLLEESKREVLRLTGAIEEEIYRCTNPKKASPESDCSPRRSIRARSGDTASGSEEAGDGGRFRFPDISPRETDRGDVRRDETV